MLASRREECGEGLKQKVMIAFLQIIQMSLDEEDEMTFLIRYIRLFYGCEIACEDE